jgi:hypothetical protein
VPVTKTNFFFIAFAPFLKWWLPVFILYFALFRTVFRIRIHRIHIFLAHKNPDPLVRGMDPDPDLSIIKQK